MDKNVNFRTTSDSVLTILILIEILKDNWILSENQIYYIGPCSGNTSNVKADHAAILSNFISLVSIECEPLLHKTSFNK